MNLDIREALKYPSSFFLILANLIPLIGVIFFDWNLRGILGLYWTETLIIGFYNVLKMFFAEKREKRELSNKSMIPFFIFHFGGFMLVHGIFIITVTSFSSQTPSVRMVDILGILRGVGLGIVALFLSHGYSFWTNYYLKKEYKRASVSQLFNQPYNRIFVMHLTIVLGMILATYLGRSVSLLLLFIALKIITDLDAHIKERKKFQN